MTTTHHPRSFMSPMITSRVMSSHYTMPLFFYEKMRSRQTAGCNTPRNSSQEFQNYELIDLDIRNQKLTNSPNYGADLELRYGMWVGRAAVGEPTAVMSYRRTDKKINNNCLSGIVWAEEASLEKNKHRETETKRNGWTASVRCFLT